MSYSIIQRCRICQAPHLHSILHLGEQGLTGVFPKSRTEVIETGPVELVKCDEQQGGCGLVQLHQSYDAHDMYGQNYGYRSGLNRSMVEHLRRRVQAALAMARPQPGDFVLDIGSNDSTTLQAYPPHSYRLVGMDPTGVKFARFYPPHIALIPEFFNADTLRKKFPGCQAKIITSFAMFYDLEAPGAFMADIHRILADDGIWVFEQSYLPALLQQNAYDTICHEHLNYYALRQIKWMTDRAGFQILDVEPNDVNGGSFCVTVAKEGAPYPANGRRVESLLAREEALGLHTLTPFTEFRERVFAHRDDLRNFMTDVARKNKTIYGYGASTKGNVLLQFCNLTARDLPAIAEINEDKFGAYTPRTLIPIRSEAEVRAFKPDYLLVLPWHFRAGIVRREAEYLAAGGRLVFPLPGIDVVDRGVDQRAA
jgi:NDP-4-keto-2,6-dideoxyhexose 3-C-methyltransferase